MIVPQGLAWQKLRQDCLRLLPEGVNAFYKNAPNLAEWREQGYYTVGTFSSKSTTINALTLELGSVLLAESAWLLDHAAEHRATIKAALESPWFSPAWLLVTTYYWSYFSAMCLTRLVGRTTWFLDDNALSKFKTLAQVATGSTKPGTFRAEVVVGASGSDCEFRLASSGKRPHEAAWVELLKLIRGAAAASDAASNLNEYRMWNCFKNAADALGDDWPSQVRNKVNYRTGTAYREVVGVEQMKIRAYIAKASSLGLDEYLDLFETAISRIVTFPSEKNNLELSCRLVYLNAVGLARLAETLNSDLIERVNADVRWTAKRKGWLKSRCYDPDSGVWPFQQ